MCPLGTHHGTVVVTAKHIRIRMQERFHQAAIQPTENRSRLELKSLFDHPFERIRQLELVLGPYIIFHQIIKGRF